ncbi:MAG: phenylalanine--tRNA ligase subunit beta [Chloroflexota bacterium]
MKAPLSWLAEFVDLDLTPDALATRLTLLGMEVRAVESRGGDWKNVVVGELLTVEPHPKADRLSLTTVFIGVGEPLAIVCGATNIAPGQRVPVALPGAVLPGDRRIERTEKMGIVSNGMLCSGDELGLTSDSAGILILPGSAPVGATLASLYGDTVLDIDVKPNRGDALSIVGLAREIGAITGTPIRFPAIDVIEGGMPVGERLSVTIADQHLCPRFVGRWVGGLKVGASPDWVQMRLAAAGVRPISNVVDASNYVMLELGKPIHTFDAAAVRNGRLEVRTARPGERLVTLDHIDRSLDDQTLLIAGDDGPLAIAGVMGGAESEVGDGTSDVIVESAIFDPVSIRRTAFAYALRSEASLRFEKGQEFRLARLGADRTAQLLAAWAGGTAAPGRIDTAPDEPEAARVAFRPGRTARLVGLELSAEVQSALLGRAGITVESPPASEASVSVPIARGSRPLDVTVPVADTLFAVVPSWRRDLEIEVDVVEEVARLNGYDQVPSTLPATPMPAFRQSPMALRDRLREDLAGLGLREVVTHALVARGKVEAWAWARPVDAAEGEAAAGGELITLTNPLSIDHATLRQGLVWGVLNAIAVNRRRGQDDLALFEIGKGYGRVGDDVHEWWRLALGLAGAFDPPAWNRPRRAADLDDLKGIVAQMCRLLDLPAPIYEAATSEPTLHPGRSARVTATNADGRVGLVGFVGEVHPGRAAAEDERVVGTLVAELSIAGLSIGQPPVARGVMPSRFPEVERDIAVVVADSVFAAEIEARIRASAGPLLRSLRLFDIYQGQPLAASERSLAYRLVFAADRTLAEEEVEAAVRAVTEAVIGAGGRIRA